MAISLGLAVVIVIATLWLFLGSPSATLIPCASIPIALLLVVSYLTISLVFAFVLNVVNDRLALVER